MLFSGKKTIAAALLLTAAGAGAAVQVSEGKILLGNSFQIPNSAIADFECRITNPDPKPHRVMIRLRPDHQYGSVNINSPEIRIPPRTTTMIRFPVQLSNDEKYQFSVYQDGSRRPESTINNCSVKIPENRVGMVGILNDDGDAPGGFKQNRFLYRSLAPVSFRAGSLPDHGRCYQLLHALIVCRPDFSQYTSEQYTAILEYVANGGLLVFADPEGALAAASTPLAELLPVIPLGIRMIPVPDQLAGGNPRKETNPPEIKFLDSIPKNDRKGAAVFSLSGFPVLYECRYGLGTVRFLAFAPVQENFPPRSKLADLFTAWLLNGPEPQQSFFSFREPLDQLTGFPVPATSSVRNLLILYFAVLLAILFFGFRWKHHGGAWLACTLAALVLTGALLLAVNRTLGKRGAMAAVLRIVNAQLPGTGYSCVSVYAPAAMETTVRGNGPCSLFEALPIRSGPGMYSPFQNLNASPLDLRSIEGGAMEIRNLNLAARTSRQVLEHPASAAPPDTKSGWTVPKFFLNAEGIRMEPWKVPDPARAEAAFVLFPNGSKPAELNPDGTCVMKNHDSAIADPLLENLRKAMEKSYAKKYPAVVIVSGDKIHHAGVEEKFSQQGKTLTVYPGDLIAESKSVLIPGELLALTPPDTASKLAVISGRINSQHSLQPGMQITINLNRPDGLSLPAVFTSALVRVSISNNDKIEPVVKLFPSRNVELPGKKAKSRKVVELHGKKVKDGEYLFTGDEVKGLFARMEPATLTVEGRSRQTKRGDADLTTGNWSLLDLQVELRGKIEPINQEKTK
ncbi:MAG: hypothetical protein J5806_14340 [Lentisphaeria bacterium]|nr:hypothetical protein [Lentisphaeria bacterium]